MGDGDRLDEPNFSYRLGRDGRVFIDWHGRQVMALKGRAAESFLRKIEGRDARAAQLAMAKVTGNFKRGNERP
jgi:hypothetical protein